MTAPVLALLVVWQTAAAQPASLPAEGDFVVRDVIFTSGEHPSELKMRRVKHGKYVLLPISPETRGHGTPSLPAIWGEHLRAFLTTRP